MSELNIRCLDPDEQLLVRLCLKLNLLTAEQIQATKTQHSGKQLFFALCDSGFLDSEQITELLRLREYSWICPHCNSLNFQDSAGSPSNCRRCHTSPRVRRDTTVLVGQTFEKYKIIEEIADGSVGIVYKARHELLNRLAALKILKSEQVTEDLLLRFEREAKTIATLDHPNIVRVYDIGEECGIHYIAMEYLSGKPLGDYIEKRQISIRQAVDFTAKIAAGLHHAHKASVIHRDIKPENIIIVEGNIPKITDFGLARQISQNVRLTQQNMIMGTPLYMSPEQAMGHELNATTDIYSLGVVLYEMLTRRTPFFHHTTLTLLQKIISEKPTPPRELNPAIPLPLQRVCLKALEKDSKDRYGDIREMLEDLGEIAKNDSTRIAAPAKKIANDKPKRRPISNRPISTNLSALATPKAAKKQAFGKSAATKIEDEDLVPEAISGTAVQRQSAMQKYWDQERARQEERVDFWEFLGDPIFVTVLAIFIVAFAYLLYKVIVL